MINVDVEWDGDDLEAALDAVEPEMAAQLPVALKLSADVAAARAKSDHDYTDRTSSLTNSIGSGEVTGSWPGDDLSVPVSAGAPHAAAIEYGARPHVIEPRHRRGRGAKALRIPMAGGFLFRRRVQHPGNRGHFFLRGAVDATLPDAESAIAAAVDVAFARAGLP